jgi:hypothetical protein
MYNGDTKLLETRHMPMFGAQGNTMKPEDH